ncbi:ThiJ/PfpI family protein [Metarhizium guizhouense ARSEF 977]|uniref:ThiJ/PfpI family protein n=1 Tax=Metarhizium guizhouense (strain ARSEF 977) TaxID=1276136 RepID=A0A0B4IAQ7_METGA|nr:ThiJ/PfpI family protein [Metarhizium guizhouense ARSEF 977]
MAPVWMRPPLPGLNKAGSNFTASFNPTHTFDNPPDDIEILLVPGGLGMRRGNSSEPVVDFVRKTYPKVKYLLTTCTGAGVAARAGVLDGKRATTNKAAWNEIVKMGPNVKWVSPARWTVDGNIWTSSGVTSGFDLIFEFIDTVYNKTTSHTIQGAVEYVRAKDPCDDPFAKWHNIPPSGDCRDNK